MYPRELSDHATIVACYQQGPGPSTRDIVCRVEIAEQNRPTDSSQELAAWHSTKAVDHQVVLAVPPPVVDAAADFLGVA